MYKSELDAINKLKNESEEIKIALSLPNEHKDKLLKAKEELAELMKVVERTKLIEK